MKISRIISNILDTFYVHDGPTTLPPPQLVESDTKTQFNKLETYPDSRGVLAKLVDSFLYPPYLAPMTPFPFDEE